MTDNIAAWESPVSGTRPGNSQAAQAVPSVLISQCELLADQAVHPNLPLCAIANCSQLAKFFFAPVNPPPGTDQIFQSTALEDCGFPAGTRRIEGGAQDTMTGNNLLQCRQNSGHLDAVARSAPSF